MSAAKPWITVPVDGGGISIRKNAILAVTETKGTVLITLSGTTTQLRLAGVTRDRLMQLISPPRYDEYE